MNKILSFAFFGVLLAAPAYAQHSMSGTLGPNGAGYISGGVGGSGSQGAGYGAGSLSGVQIQTLPAIPPATLNAVDVSGTPADFVPSSWTEFQGGLARGRAELNAEQKTLGQIAEENRKIEKPRAKLAIVQDASGRAVIQRQ